MYHKFQTKTDQVVDGIKTVVHQCSWNQREQVIHLSGWTHIKHFMHEITKRMLIFTNIGKLQQISAISFRKKQLSLIS